MYLTSHLCELFLDGLRCEKFGLDFLFHGFLLITKVLVRFVQVQHLFIESLVVPSQLLFATVLNFIDFPGELFF